MGADLYIKCLFDPNYQKYEPLFNEWVERRDDLYRQGKAEEAMELQEKVSEYYNLMYSEGYFRDSYNSSNLLWMFGIGWWEDILNLIDEDGLMSPENASILLSLIKQQEAKFEKQLKARTPWKGWSKEEMETYFRDKYQEFQEFLNKSIELKEPIWCSV